jgi:hypothetical protein
MQTSTWALALATLPQGATVTSRTGRTYEVAEHAKTAIVLSRPDSGSTVRVTRSLIERTAERLEAGEVIPRRRISYTVAIEEGVVAALADIIEVTAEGYRVAE